MQESFDQVWSAILAHQGEIFSQVRGGQFTYQVRGTGLALSRTRQVLPRSVLERAWKRFPVSGPGELNDLRGPSYLYALLADDRITGLAAQAYEREKAQARLIIVEGLLAALDAWPAITATIWAARDRTAAHAALRVDHGIPEMVAQYVLDMPLGRTTELARADMSDEAAQLRAIVAGGPKPGRSY